MSTAFLFCTEKPIEASSVLLAQSIRDLGKSLADSPMYSFQPRSGYEISPWVNEAFKRLKVEHITEPLNKKYTDYPPGNKPFAAAFAEKNLPHDQYIFCDSDKLVVNDLSSALVREGYDIAVRPTHGKGVACYDENDPNMEYWGEIWDDFDLAVPKIRVETTKTMENIIGYWNSGLLVVTRQSGIFTKWKEMLEHIKDKPIIPAANTFYLDQIALAAVLHGRPSKVQSLPLGFNYPIHRHFLGELPPKNIVHKMEKLYTVHYHGLIRDPFFVSMFNSFENSKPIAQWFYEQIKRYNIEPHCQPFRRSYLQSRMYLYRALKKYNLR